MEIKIDRSVYSDSCISKAIYKLSGDISFNRRLLDNVEIVDCRSDKFSDSEIQSLFLQTLNDYKLRSIIAEETKDIRTILYAKAFAESEDFDGNIND